MALPAYPDPYCVELVAKLTPRETEILILRGKGLTQFEIGAALRLHHGTVNDYLKSIHVKFDVHTGVEAAVIAAKAGLL